MPSATRSPRNRPRALAALTHRLRQWGLFLLLVSVLIAVDASGAQVASARKSTMASPPRAATRQWILEWTEEDCLSCHEMEQPLFSHPIGVKPSMSVPADLPLVEDRLACTTCHSDSPTAHGASRQKHDGMLRRASRGVAFCASCHLADETEGSKGHAMATGRAHLQWDNRQSAADTGSIVLGVSASGDEPTRECRSCHDGTSGPNIGNSHSVGIRYKVGGRPNSRAGRGSTLTPSSRLDSRIRLFDDKVECGSCHSPYSPLPKLLVMANDRSELCRSCHNRH